MKRLEEFRVYYNHTIHPELLRLERRRLRLVALMSVSSLMLVGIIILDIYINLFLVTLLIIVFIVIYIGYLLYQIRRFVLTFKPHVMNLILDFIDDGLNFDQNTPLEYDAKRPIDKQHFTDSRLFTDDIASYEGEDYIRGKVGEIPFELSELNVQSISPVLNDLNLVFKGIFLRATFNIALLGQVVVWPRSRRPYLVRPIKKLTRAGGVNADDEIMTPAFRERFMTYAMPDTHVAGMLPEPLQEAIVQYCREGDREIFFSFLNSQIYIAVSEPKDILEPFIFQSILSFEMVREFFEDISLLIRIVEEFDRTH